MTTTEQDSNFEEYITSLVTERTSPNPILEDVVDWVKCEIDIQEVYDDHAIKTAAKTYDIDEVFDQDDLEQWALDNDFVKVEE